MYIKDIYSLFSEPSLYYLNSIAVLTKYPDHKDKTRILEGLTPDILTSEKNRLEWFVGFTEAEGMFSISKECNLSLRINLHSDDLISLKYIKSLLSELANREIGSIVESKRVSESYYHIGKLKDIYEILIPIFTEYFMTTSKHLDFSYFKKAADIKAKAYLENRALNNEELVEILALKSNMNTNRKNFDLDAFPKRDLIPNRLLVLSKVMVPLL